MKDIDCAECPLSWEERSYEGECIDCGCLIYKNLYTGRKFFCHLPEFIKGMIADYKNARIEKEMEKQYEDISDWYLEQQDMECAMRNAIVSGLLHDRYGGGRFLCYEESGKLHKLNMEDILIDGAYRVLHDYEDQLEEIKKKRMEKGKV